jgi:3-isopropylmalate dehydratase small subunit
VTCNKWFGDIFATNSTQIGLLTIAPSNEQLDGLKAASEATVDPRPRRRRRRRPSISFDFDPFRRHKR